MVGRDVDHDARLVEELGRDLVAALELERWRPGDEDRELKKRKKRVMLVSLGAVEKKKNRNG